MGKFGERLLKWIEGVLKNRFMRTTIKDRKTTWKNVTDGVSQGSLLANNFCNAMLMIRQRELIFIRMCLLMMGTHTKK